MKTAAALGGSPHATTGNSNSNSNSNSKVNKDRTMPIATAALPGKGSSYPSSYPLSGRSDPSASLKRGSRPLLPHPKLAGGGGSLNKARHNYVKSLDNNMMGIIISILLSCAIATCITYLLYRFVPVIVTFSKETFQIYSKKIDEKGAKVRHHL